MESVYTFLNLFLYVLVCKYNKQGAWSECDSTGKKTKALILKSGNPQVCEANKKITKPCHKGSGHGGHKIISKGRGGGKIFFFV